MNQIKYWSNYSIRFEISNIRTALTVAVNTIVDWSKVAIVFCVRTGVSVCIKLIDWKLRSMFHDQVEYCCCVLFAELTKHVKHALTTDNITPPHHINLPRPLMITTVFSLHILNVTLIYYVSLVNFLIMKFYIYKFRKRYCFLNCEVTQHKIKLRTTGKITLDISLLWKQKIKCWTNTEATCCCCYCYYNVTMQTNRMLMASALMLDCFSRTRTVLRWPCWMATWRAATWTNENVVSSI